jgi:hypothetical protein
MLTTKERGEFMKKKKKTDTQNTAEKAHFKRV